MPIVWRIRLLLIVLGFAALIWSGSSSMAQSEQRPPKIDSSVFAALPFVENAKLSPDGTKVLFRGQMDGHEAIGLRAASGGPSTGIPIPPGYDLEWVRWAGNNRLLFSVSRLIMYLGDPIARESGLLVRDLPDGELRFIGKKMQGLKGDDVLYVDPSGDYILMAMQNSLYDFPGVYRVSLANNDMKQIVGPKPPVREWYADDSGIVRIGLGWSNDRALFYYRKNADDDFRKVGSIRWDDKKEVRWYDISLVVAGSDEGYAFSDEKTGRQALYRINYMTGELGEQVYADDRYDIDSLQLSRDGTQLEAIYYADDRDRIVWFDPEMKKVQAMIDKAAPDQQAWVVSRSLNGRKMLVLGTAPNDPGVYYLLDRDTKQMAIWAERRSGLPPQILSSTKAVVYQARDGTDIPAFLTLPKGRDPKGLPLIIMPHGGPYGVRDKLEYDPEVQFLANRGYAVLQPNYRGSGGYGTKFSDAGEGQIGRAMQDDLDDGMDWLVKQGVVDAARVCVVGSSYGGYAALWAVIRNPERYRCAISYAGVSDWESILRYDRQFFTRRGSREWNSQIQGSSGFDLSSVSPLSRAKDLNRPVLIGHGEDDARVPLGQSKKLADKLKGLGKTVEYVEYKDEGHGFSKPENKKDWLDRMDSFLTRYNPSD